MSENTAFKTNAISKQFGSFQALADISIAVPKGQIYGFIGRNGAGKTTFMRIVCGLMRPSSGTLNAQERISFLPQNVRFRDRMSGEEALRLFAKLKHGDFSESVRFAKELEIDLTKQTDCMSPGQQRKLQLAITTIGLPEVLVLDEPTAGLDPTGVQQVRSIIKLLHQKGSTVFISSHVLMELENLCNTVAVIDSGRLLYQGPCSTTYEIETDGVGEQIVTFLSESQRKVFTSSGETLLASVDRQDIPSVLQVLYEKNIRVFGVRRQGIESLYNSLVREDG